MTKFLIYLLFICSWSWATEVDNFTQRYEAIDDSLDKINKEINFRISKALKRANRNKTCQPSSLLKELKRQFVFFGYSKFEIWMQLNEDLPKKKVLKKHIYHDADLLSSGSTVNLPFTMSPLFKIDGHLIGADKFSHLFTEGWIYFEKLTRDQISLEEILEAGFEKEAGLWGGLTMGIVSYGDLMANFLGLQFWQAMLGKAEFINAGPYLECQKNNWIQVEPINIAKFLHPALDEGINCNYFTKPKLKEKFEENIQKLEDSQNRKFSCPINLNACAKLKESFPTINKWLMNPLCL